MTQGRDCGSTDVGFDGISAFTWLRSCPEPRELTAYLLSTAIVLGSTASAFSPVLSLLLHSTKWKRLILILGLLVAGPLLFRPARVARCGVGSSMFQYALFLWHGRSLFSVFLFRKPIPQDGLVSGIIGEGYTKVAGSEVSAKG